MDADGTNQQQLTVHAGANVWPTLSPDKRYIVFTSDRSWSCAYLVITDMQTSSYNGREDNISFVRR